MKTYILGHQKPDTDSVASALAAEFLFSQSQAYSYPQPVAAIADPLNPETSYLFEQLKLTPPQLITASNIDPVDQVVLVDHNEASQRLANLDPNQIVEIIDHHKVNLNLNSPISLTFKPWGSTCTIIYHLMKLYLLQPKPVLATLMLAAILSDTVGFKSATTTPIDQKIGHELAKIAGIKDISSFTLEIFKAKSNLDQLTDDQIVTNDYKIFDFGLKTLINQIETVEQNKILKRKPGLLKAMAKIKKAQKVDLVFCAITDIIKTNTKLLCLSNKELSIARKAFGGRVGESVVNIGPKLSRKKEIAPAIEKVLIQK